MVTVPRVWEQRILTSVAEVPRVVTVTQYHTTHQGYGQDDEQCPTSHCTPQHYIRSVIRIIIITATITTSLVVIWWVVPFPSQRHASPDGLRRLQGTQLLPHGLCGETRACTEPQRREGIGGENVDLLARPGEGAVREADLTLIYPGVRVVEGLHAELAPHDGGGGTRGDDVFDAGVPQHGGSVGGLVRVHPHQGDRSLRPAVANFTLKDETTRGVGVAVQTPGGLLGVPVATGVRDCLKWKKLQEDKLECKELFECHVQWNLSNQDLYSNIKETSLLKTLIQVPY